MQIISEWQIHISKFGEFRQYITNSVGFQFKGETVGIFMLLPVLNFNNFTAESG